MTAPAEQIVEQEQDCSDEIGHWFCADCNGEPSMGKLVRALCGVYKRYGGPRRDLLPCVVCDDLRRGPCGRCAK